MHPRPAIREDADSEGQEEERDQWADRKRCRRNRRRRRLAQANASAALVVDRPRVGIVAHEPFIGGRRRTGIRDFVAAAGVALVPAGRAVRRAAAVTNARRAGLARVAEEPVVTSAALVGRSAPVMGLP